MSSIGGQLLYITGGKLRRIGVGNEDISRRGVDGHAFRWFGLKSGPARIMTLRDFDTAILADAAIDVYKAMQGYPVTVIDEILTGYLNVMVRRVDPVRTKTTGTAVGGFGTLPAGRVIVEAQWILQTTE